MLPIDLNLLQSLGDPLSRAVVPLIGGLMRRELLRSGAKRHEIQIGNIPINYYDTSETTPTPLPILLIHGLADNALTWTFVMRRLAHKHDLYAIDLPGYGLSGVPPGKTYATITETCDVLQGFLQHVVRRPVLVVGNSMGAWLAVKLAWAEQRLVRGIVLINAGGAPLDGRTSWEPFARTIEIPNLVTARLVLRQLFGSIPSPLLYLGQRGVQDLFRRQAVQLFVADVQENEFLSSRDLQALPMPAALIWGCRDLFLPKGSQEFFATNLPRAQHLLLKRCGHLPQYERPGAVAHFLHMFALQCQQQASVT